MHVIIWTYSFPLYFKYAPMLVKNEMHCNAIFIKSVGNTKKSRFRDPCINRPDNHVDMQDLGVAGRI